MPRKTLQFSVVFLSAARSCKSEGDSVDGPEDKKTTINGLESPVDQQQQRHHSTTQPMKNATKTASSSRSSTEAAATSTSTTRAAGNSTNSVLPPVLHHLVQLFDEIIATTDRVAATALTPSPFLVDAAKMPASINPGMVTAEGHTYLPTI